MAIKSGERLERARRLMTVQAQMRRVAELDLVATRAQVAAVEADRAALLAALGASAHGPVLMEATARRLRALGAQATELTLTAGEQAERVRERGLAQKRAEAQADRLTVAHRRETERREGLERLDGMIARSGDASLP